MHVENQYREEAEDEENLEDNEETRRIKKFDEVYLD